MPPAFKAFITGTFKSIDVDGTSKGRAKIKGRKVKDKNRPWISHCSIKKCASTFFFKDYFENDWSVSYFCLHTKYVLQDCILRLISFSESTKISVWQFRENNEKRKAKKFKNPFAKKRTFAEFPIMKHDYAVSRIWLF